MTILEKPKTIQVIAAFLAVYIIWGSTYLAIRFSIETMPPFLMAGARFLISGLMLYGWGCKKEPQIVKPAHWRSALIVGSLLLVGGNGCVVWAEQKVPSGAAALLIATVPLWMALIQWFRNPETKPGILSSAGILLGFFGVWFLASSKNDLGVQAIDPTGAIVLVIASFSWALGSLYSRKAFFPSSSLISTGMQMICGGLVLILIGMIAGEYQVLNFLAISLRSWAAFLYLIFFGSFIGFTAYMWILKVSTPTRVSTYAYVNPVVAVFLGWFFAGEKITLNIFLGAAVILASVAVITLSENRKTA